MGATDLRRTFGWSIVAGLCLAAAVAVVALLSGEFEDTDARIVATSLGFSVFTAVGAPGVGLYRRGASLRLLGGAAAATAAVSYLLLLAAIWIDDDANDLWQVWGVVAVAALGFSHATLVTAGRRASDSPAVRALVGASIVLGALDSTVAGLTIAGVFADVDEAWVRVFGVTLVLLLLTTVLPPIMRRLNRAASALQPGLADELEAIAARLSKLDGPPQIDAEAAALRRLAASQRGK